MGLSLLRRFAAGDVRAAYRQDLRPAPPTLRAGLAWGAATRGGVEMSIPLDEQHDLKQGPNWLVRMALDHPEAASWGVRSWYVLLCVLPFAAAAFLPWWLLPELGGG